MESHITIDRRLAAHRDRYAPPEDPPNTLLLAYEDRRYNKMGRELRDSHDELKSKILRELVQDMVNGNKVVLATMTSSLIEVLVDHLEYPHDEIRELSSQALAQFCKVIKPRDIIIERRIPEQIKKRIDDKVVEIRRNAYTAMLAMTRMVEGAVVLIEIGMVATLVDKLLHETHEAILVQVHELLRQLLLVDGGTSKMVEIEDIAIERLHTFVDSKNWQLREAALKNLYSFSFDYRGKKLMLQHKCVFRTLPSLGDEVLAVRTAAALVLASLVQFNQGKHEIIDHNHFLSIIRMLDTETEDEILLNLIQLITSLAEDNAHGRKLAAEAIPRLEKFSRDTSSVLSTYARDAIEVITWKP